MSISATAFAAALPALRPGLLQWAARKRPCSPDDAEDLVCESVRMALLILPEFHDNTGPDGLRNWMIGILRCVMLTDRQRAARRVRTVPIAAAEQLPAPPPIAQPESDPLEEQVRQLPANQADLVRDYFAGYRQVEIAFRHNLHSNTVANRLKAAFRTLNEREPGMTYYTSDFDFCCQVTLYSRPIGVWKSWRHTHPRDIRLRLYLG